MEYIEAFQLEDVDYNAIEIAKEVAYRLLKHPYIKPEQIIGLGNALYALERLPVITEGTHCEFDVIYYSEKREIKCIVFRISEEVFEVFDSYCIGPQASYRYSNNHLWFLNIHGYKNRGCNLDDFKLMIDDILNKDIMINVIDDTYIESDTIDTSYKDVIIDYYAEKACKKISQKIIRMLQTMTEGMMSGDDSPLKNLWEEVCVQVQWEEFIVWDLYLDMIEDMITTEMKNLDVNEEKAIWLQTDEGKDWIYEDKEGFACSEIPFCTDEAVRHILNKYILTSAANWNNKRMERYLETCYVLD